MTKEEIIDYVNRYGTGTVQIAYPELLNTKVHGYHKSRYIASWANVGGKFDDGNFEKWLLTIPFDDGHMSEEEADEISRFACGGKFEFQNSAREFLSKA